MSDEQLQPDSAPAADTAPADAEQASGAENPAPDEAEAAGGATATATAD
jgi:hypothetical protein